MEKKIVFKYHPNVYDNDIIEHENGVSDGKAAEKFEGVFIQDAESGLVSDPQKTEELFKRTPGYASWQGEYWLA